ncbi:hypothetical protein TEA_012627 [Camellia sinensis var. sinensis]|uniref:Uncharacterized protein n=1 Tax=Camellia sinensis var. sinensis TaxID=542762 RepID=A0A4V3WR12_CAMSN|nr:hypothetical protein TEA_012627 [Camellia sinensis var. sinensis]
MQMVIRWERAGGKWGRVVRCREDVIVNGMTKGEGLAMMQYLYHFQFHSWEPKHGLELSTIPLLMTGVHGGSKVKLPVPFLGTQAWIRALNYSIVDDWRSWWVQGQVAGYTRTYSNRMTFATAKGGEHIAPQDKPVECRAMFERWISNQPL